MRRFLTIVGLVVTSQIAKAQTTIPATIQAENYTSMSGVQTETTSDAGGGLNVGWIDPNDYMAYSINVPCSRWDQSSLHLNLRPHRMFKCRLD